MALLFRFEKNHAEFVPNMIIAFEPDNETSIEIVFVGRGPRNFRS
jgi:hypothetical protein